LKRGLKVVFHNISLSGEMYSLRMADLLKKEGQYKYGEDFLALPYKAGGESVVAQMGRDFRGLYQNDMYGTALGQVPLWDRVKTVKDFSAVINFVSAQDGLFYISQLEKQYGITLVYGGTAVFGPQMTNFFQTGQVKGLVMGLSGAAEYELIAGFPGKATSGMSAQSVSHAFIILLIIMGNIGYFGSKRRKEVAL
jgi:hypothetical protein